VKGRPPGSGLRQKISDATRDGDDIIEVVVQVLKDRSARNADKLEAARWLGDRLYGRAPEIIANAKVDLSATALGELTREQLEALASLAKPLPDTFKT